MDVRDGPLKKAECWRIDAFELWCWRRLLRVPWTARRSNQSMEKEISPEYSLEAEAPIIWPPDVKNGLIGKDPDAGNDWRQEEKVMTKDKMVGWHHWLDGHKFEQAPGDGDGQRILAYCSPRGHKESDMTDWTDSSYLTANKPIWEIICFNWHDIYKHNFKVLVQWHLVHSQWCDITIFSFKTFSSPPIKVHKLVTPHFPFLLDPSNHWYAFCLYVFIYSGHFKYV